MNRFRRADPHTLAGAYALDALAGEDRAAFGRHLGGCEACRQEAASLREAAARLATAATASPPPELRDRVLAAASRTWQEPPPQPGAGRVRSRGLVAPLAPRMAVALAGAAILMALGLGGLVVHTQRGLNADAARGAAVAGVLTAPDAHMMSTRVSGGGTAAVVMSRRQRALVLTTARLPALVKGRRYEIWLIGAHGTHAAGMLPAPRHDMTGPVLVTGLSAGDTLCVSSEPAAGAARPGPGHVLMMALPD